MYLFLVSALQEGQWLIRKGTKNGNRNNAQSNLLSQKRLGPYSKHNRRFIDALRNIYRDSSGLIGDSQYRVSFVYKPSVIRSGWHIWGHWDVESVYFYVFESKKNQMSNFIFLTSKRHFLGGNDVGDVSKNVGMCPKKRLVGVTKKGKKERNFHASNWLYAQNNHVNVAPRNKYASLYI